MAFLSSLFKRKEKIAAEPDRSLSTDFHSHLLPGLDDGVATVEESLEILRELYGQGVRKVITTPHIINDLYPNTHEQIAEALHGIQEAVQEQLPDMQFSAAAEYYLDEWFIETYLKQDNPPLCLSDTYVLVETNYVDRPAFLEEVFFELQLRGYKVVFAHPERYHYLLKDFRHFETLAASGILFQANMMSFTGHYGPQVKKAAEYLLKNQLLHALGSDIHKIEHARQIGFLKRLPVYQELLQLPLLNREL